MARSGGSWSGSGHSWPWAAETGNPSRGPGGAVAPAGPLSPRWPHAVLRPACRAGTCWVPGPAPSRKPLVLILPLGSTPERTAETRSLCETREASAARLQRDGDGQLVSLGVGGRRDGPLACCVHLPQPLVSSAEGPCGAGRAVSRPLPWCSVVLTHVHPGQRSFSVTESWGPGLGPTFPFCSSVGNFSGDGGPGCGWRPGTLLSPKATGRPWTMTSRAHRPLYPPGPAGLRAAGPDPAP